jgi:hypothetical protein
VSQVPFFDIARYAHEAGFRGEPHAIVVALAQPESNRVADAHNPGDPFKGSHGLLQVNGVHLLPGGTLETWVVEDLYDPAKNLKAAFLVWQANGQSFEPWGAFVNGLHKPSLDAAKVALDGFARWRVAESQKDYHLARAAACAASLDSANRALALERDRVAAISADYDSVVSANALLQDRIARAKAALA